MYGRTRVKVCGITTMKDAKAAVDSGVDAIGFIFVESSPRYIPPEVARKITKKLPAFVQIVGVFMDQDPVEVEEIIEYCRLTCVQLHGSESPEYCRKLGKAAPPCKIVKAFRVGRQTTAAHFEGYGKYVSGYLLDTYVDGQEGGTGKAFDWSIIEALDLTMPIILAGGLTPDNVAEGIAAVRPFSVDVNSGVEKKPGEKDHKKLQALMRQVAYADRKND